MKVERFDPGTDSASVRACHDIYLSGLPDDDPLGPPMTPRAFAGWLALGWTEDPLETWLARDDSGEPCGWYALNLPQRENRQLAGLSLVVHAAGAGRAGARRCSATRPAGRAGRPDGARNGRAGGFARRGVRGDAPGPAAATAVQRVLALADLPGGQRAALRAEAEPAAPGYTAADLARSRARGHGGRGCSSSTGRWPTRPAKPARRRRPGTRPGSGWTSAGSRPWECAPMWSRPARRAPGDLAALTQVCVDPAMPGWGFQELTAVARPHRGHRLGLLLKLAMLDRLAAREAQVTRIVTGNADGNEHMIAINEQLGFRVLGRWPSWELDVADMPANLAGWA